MKKMNFFKSAAIVLVVLLAYTACNILSAAQQPTASDNRLLKAAWTPMVQQLKSNAEAWEGACKEDASVSAEDIQKCKVFAAFVAKTNLQFMGQYLSSEQNAVLGSIIGAYADVSDVMQKYAVVKSIDVLLSVFGGDGYELYCEKAANAVLERMENNEEAVQAAFWYNVSIGDKPTAHYEAAVVVCDYIMYYMAEGLLNNL